MKEHFKKVKFTGDINISLGGGRVWSAEKAFIMSEIVKVGKEYAAAGYVLTLRQLYYQLVAADTIPNHDKVYKKLSQLKDDCVYSGLLDWETFEDRGRVPKIAYFENSVKGALERSLEWYAVDRQIGQPNHIEVWTEKDAISDILKRVTDQYTIRLVINKGYSSSTAMYSAYRRFMEAIGKGQKVTILYFGDHDPSGLDMVRDISDRILFFMVNGSRKLKVYPLISSWTEEADTEVLRSYFEDQKEVGNDWAFKAFFDNWFEVRHVGLTQEQIKTYKPPHNPAKITDSRAANYIKEFGPMSWEVDALKPAVMTRIIDDAINEYLDADAYAQALEKEESDKEELGGLIDQIQ